MNRKFKIKNQKHMHRTLPPAVAVQVSKIDSESGQVLVWTLVLLPLLLALVGLVFDGGLLWSQYRRGRWAADGAAVAAASEIDPALYASTGQMKLDPNRAASTARKFALDNNPALSLSSVTVSSGRVQVAGTLKVRPAFLGLFGVGPLELTVRGEERPAWGISREGQ